MSGNDELECIQTTNYSLENWDEIPAWRKITGTTVKTDKNKTILRKHKNCFDVLDILQMIQNSGVRTFTDYNGRVTGVVGGQYQSEYLQENTIQPRDIEFKFTPDFLLTAMNIVLKNEPDEFKQWLKSLGLPAVRAIHKYYPDVLKKLTIFKTAYPDMFIFAAKIGYTPLLEFILKKSNINDLDVNNAMDYAIEHNYKDIIKLLTPYVNPDSDNDDDEYFDATDGDEYVENEEPEYIGPGYIERAGNAALSLAVMAFNFYMLGDEYDSTMDLASEVAAERYSDDLGRIAGELVYHTIQSLIS